MADLKGINPTICMHKIILEECHSNSVEPQRRLNPAMKKVVMKEIIKWLDAGVIYPISDSSWVSPVQRVPKKGGITVVNNDENELLPTRTVTGWRICIYYRKLNKATKKDHFPLPFIDQMLDRLAGKEFYCFLDGYSRYNQIAIAPEEQEKKTFTCPYGTYAFRRMPFGLCNAPATFQRCMLAIFLDMVEEFLEVFMDDFSVSGETFDSCLGNIAKVLKRCEEADLVLNWEKCHFMVNEGTILGHKISSKRIEVDKANVEVIEKLPPPINVKGIRSFLGHAGFYRRFIKDFSKISKPLCNLLQQNQPFVFDKECQRDTGLGALNEVVEAPGRMHSMMALHSTMTCVFMNGFDFQIASLGKARRQGGSRHNFCSTQIRAYLVLSTGTSIVVSVPIPHWNLVYRYCYMVPVRFAFGTDTHILVSVRFDIGIGTLFRVSVPFDTGIGTTLEYRYWKPGNSFWSPLKPDPLRVGP
ncbi:hypothetical protein V6N13_123152 [Hibiscus sabdariffa]